MKPYNWYIVYLNIFVWFYLVFFVYLAVTAFLNQWWVMSQVSCLSIGFNLSWYLFACLPLSPYHLNFSRRKWLWWQGQGQGQARSLLGAVFDENLELYGDSYLVSIGELDAENPPDIFSSGICVHWNVYVYIYILYMAWLVFHQSKVFFLEDGSPARLWSLLVVRLRFPNWRPGGLWWPLEEQIERALEVVTPEIRGLNDFIWKHEQNWMRSKNWPIFVRRLCQFGGGNASRGTVCQRSENTVCAFRNVDLSWGWFLPDCFQVNSPVGVCNHIDLDGIISCILIYDLNKASWSSQFAAVSKQYSILRRTWCT